MDILHIEQLLYYLRLSLCSLELHESSKWRAMTPDTHHSRFLIQHCLHTANSYILYIALWCTTVHDNKTHVGYDYTAHQTTALVLTLFYNNKVLRHDLRAAAVHTL